MATAADQLRCASSVASRGEGAAADWEAGRRGERTISMRFISLTPEVSQLRGWLNLCAPWQGSQALTGALTRCGASCGPGGGRLGRTAVCVHAAACRGEGETADTLGGTGRGEQRTANMPPMSVTPEVSQLKGWLKACALCQGLQAGAHTGAGERRGLGGGRAASDRGVCARNVQKGEVRPIQLGGHRARGAAHSKHVSHVSDARGVPAEGLVEGVRVLPRVASRGNGVRGIKLRAWTQEARGSRPCLTRTARAGGGRDPADVGAGGAGSRAH